MSQTMQQILDSGELAGYEAREPLDSETAHIDEQAAASVPCRQCGGPCLYEPFVKLAGRKQLAYRCFAVCSWCKIAVEF